MIVTMFGNLVLIDIDFQDLFLFSSKFSLDWKDIRNTLDSVSPHLISKHLKVHQNYFTSRRIFNSFLGVWKCGLTQPSVFDMLLLKTVLTDNHIANLKINLKVKL